MAKHHINTCHRCKKQFTTVFPTASGLCRSCASLKKWDRKRKPALTCARCGQQFPFVGRKTGPQKYCSATCFEAARQNGVFKQCPACLKTFRIPASIAHRYTYCSKVCSSERGIDTVCERCGKPIRYSGVNGYIRRHCSESCRRPPVILACETCGKAFRPTPQDAPNRRFCSFVCYRRFTGESSLERITRQLLESAGVVFMAEFSIGRRDVFDFYVPASNLLIECDGTYWHAKPSAQRRDAVKEARAITAGYNVVRFSEEMIYSDSFPKHLSRALSAVIEHPQLRLFA